MSGGGAVRIFGVDSGATLDVRNLTIADGHADSGGGIYNGGTLALSNCTLSGNSATVGGAILNGVPFGSLGNLTLQNCTFVGNDGGGILSLGTLTLSNTIVANSPSGGDCGAYGEINDGGHNLIEDPENSCGLTNGVNGNIVGADPMLDPEGLKDNGGPTLTIALLDGSLAIDAGDPEVCANPPVNGLDQRGYARPGEGSVNCSIGAYEYDSPGLPQPCTGDCNHDDHVAINELIVGVNIALGRQSLANCPGFDENTRDGVEINELVTAVDNAMNGCGG